MTKPAFRFIDLFAGVGGFHHALSAPEFGGQCVLASDIDESCREVYAATWPGMPKRAIHGDIRDFTLNEDGTDRSQADLAALIPDHDGDCPEFDCLLICEDLSSL